MHFFVLARPAKAVTMTIKTPQEALTLLIDDLMAPRLKPIEVISLMNELGDVSTELASDFGVALSHVSKGIKALQSIREDLVKESQTA